jgi:hypothetical protein
MLVFINNSLTETSTYKEQSFNVNLEENPNRHWKT